MLMDILSSIIVKDFNTPHKKILPDLIKIKEGGWP